MGTHLIVLSQSYPIKKLHDRVYMKSKNLCVIVLWTKRILSIGRVKKHINDITKHNGSQNGTKQLMKNCT